MLWHWQLLTIWSVNKHLMTNTVQRKVYCALVTYSWFNLTVFFFQFLHLSKVWSRYKNLLLFWLSGYIVCSVCRGEHQTQTCSQAWKLYCPPQKHVFSHKKIREVGAELKCVRCRDNTPKWNRKCQILASGPNFNRCKNLKQNDQMKSTVYVHV